jgi:hypothetical protein
MTGAPKDTSLTIDTHHHLLPDFFWQETESFGSLMLLTVLRLGKHVRQTKRVFSEIIRKGGPFSEAMHHAFSRAGSPLHEM